MRSPTLWILLGLVALGFLGRPGQSEIGDEPPEVFPPVPDSPLETVPGGVLVDFDDDWSDDEVGRLERTLGIDLRLNSVHSDDANLYRANAFERLDDVLARLRGHEGVEAAEPEGIYRAIAEEIPDDRRHFKPDDPSYVHQWHLRQVGMPRAWKLGRGRSVVVAVIDTGVAYEDRGRLRRVPDLAQTEFVPGYDFVGDDAHPGDLHGHGTHVAGTIAQSTHNGVGVAGVAPRAAILPVRVLDEHGMGSWADIADGIRFAADHGASVINMSLGGPFPSRVIERAVRYAHERGVTVVCAAGNTGRRGVGYPARYEHSIAVAATRYDEETTFYSTWGPQIDLAAPGGDTRVDQNGDGMVDGVLQNTIVPGQPAESDYLAWMGTSMATPHVAGAAALVASAGVTDPDAIESILEDTARPKGRAERYGAGILDVESALGHTQLVLGLWALGFCVLLTLAARRGHAESPVRPRTAWVIGLLVGGTGAFFLPALVGGDTDWAWLLSRPLLGLDQAVFGARGHGHPLVYSALLPLAAAAVGYGVPRLRGLIAGLAVGIAAHLLLVAFFGTVQVLHFPWIFGKIWLLGNAAAAFGIARTVQ